MAPRGQEPVQQAIPNVRRVLWTCWALGMACAAIAVTGLIFDHVWLIIGSGVAAWMIVLGARLYFRSARAARTQPVDR
jgi:hypothetical protein